MSTQRSCDFGKCRHESSIITTKSNKVPQFRDVVGWIHCVIAIILPGSGSTPSSEMIICPIYRNFWWNIWHLFGLIFRFAILSLCNTTSNRFNVTSTVDARFSFSLFTIVNCLSVLSFPGVSQWPVIRWMDVSTSLWLYILLAVVSMPVTYLLFVVRHLCDGLDCWLWVRENDDVIHARRIGGHHSHWRWLVRQSVLH